MSQTNVFWGCINFFALTAIAFPVQPPKRLVVSGFFLYPDNPI